jgi:hypothetical protein
MCLVAVKNSLAFVRRDAKDWISGDLIDLLARESVTNLPGGDLTVHHAFPRKVLAAFVENPDDANCPANYCLLSRSTNAELSDKRPDEALAAMSPEERQSVKRRATASKPRTTKSSASGERNAWPKQSTNG